MNELSVTTANLPANLEDLSQFVLVGREQLVAVRAAIRAIDKVGVAQEVRKQKLKEGQEIGEAVLDAEVRIGELMREVPKAQGRRTDIKPTDTAVGKYEVIEKAGFTPKQVERFETLAAHPEIVAQAKAEAKENDDIVTRSLVLSMVKAHKKADEIEQARTDIENQQKERGGAVLRIGDGIGFNPIEKYDLLLTDPPYSTDVPDISEFANRWLYPALAGVKDTGFAYVFIGAYPNELQAYLEAIKPSNVTLEQVLIWTYKNTLGQNPKGRYKQNYQACLFFRGVNAPDLNCPLTSEQWAVQEINAPDGRQGDRYHAWQKPMEIAERFIRHSTTKGMTVFDPFACTGTFLLAAAKLGRKAYGFEIDPANAEIAFQRGCVHG
jgi:DNA modification methylase